MTGFKPAVKVFGEDKFHENALVFASQEEAIGYAKDLVWRWTQAEDWGVNLTDDAPTHKWEGGRAVALEEISA